MEELELWAGRAEECCESSLKSRSSGSWEGQSAERNVDSRNLFHKVAARNKNLIKNLDGGYFIIWTRIGLHSACPGSLNEFELENNTLVFVAEKTSGSENVQVGSSGAERGRSAAL